jgi:hypothetical protein
VKGATNELGGPLQRRNADSVQTMSDTDNNGTKRQQSRGIGLPEGCIPKPMDPLKCPHCDGDCYFEKVEENPTIEALRCDDCRRPHYDTSDLDSERCSVDTDTNHE